MSKQKQYINIIRNNKNIRIEHQLEENKTITQSAQSVFLLSDNNFSSDTLFKIKSLEQSIPETYISALCELKEQKIVSNKNKKDSNTKYIELNETYNISLSTNRAENAKKFNNNGHIDFLFSPYSILYQQILLNPEKNSLNIFIHNDNLYTIIIDNVQKISDFSINSITPFKEVQKSHFYEDEIVEQKLYDEIYLLELTDIISNIVKQYYEKFKNIGFIEKINLYYSMKQLNNEQLKTLSDDLMIDIQYINIDVDMLMYKLASHKHNKNFSFTKQRAKKNTFPLIGWVIALILTSLISFLIFLYLTDTTYTKSNNELKAVVTKNNTIETIIKPIKKEPKEFEKNIPESQKKTIKEIKLPHHKKINKNITSLIQNIFNSVDIESVLKEIQIQKDESTMICDFYTIQSQKRFLEGDILKFYERSETILTNKLENVITSIISNNSLISPLRDTFADYAILNNKYLSEQNALIYLQRILKQSSVSLEGNVIHGFQTYIFNITQTIQHPKEFFSTINLLSNQKYSLHLDFPIEFTKTNDILEVNYTLHLNQKIHP